MPLPLSISLPIARLEFVSGEAFSVPLTDLNALRIGGDAELLAQKYQDILQEKVLDKGNVQQLLEGMNEAEFEEMNLEVAFAASKDKVSFPAFTLNFTLFYQAVEKGFWGLVPTLGVTFFARNMEQLEKHGIEGIKLEFARKKRLRAVQDIAAAMWFNKVELVEEKLELKAYSLAELETIGLEKKKQLLPKVAQQLNVKRQQFFGQEKLINQTIQALKSPFGRSILLVGPSGVGKTTLVWEVARRAEEASISGHFWETTASTLIKELTRDTGWQEHLAHLAKEISDAGDLLFVRNLAELFEVGKYEGNDVSMADFLGTWISRGDMTLVSECTFEEMARINLSAPNFLSYFTIIRVNEPKGKNLTDIILEKVTQLSDLEKLHIEKPAIEELVRLHKRFTPYSGFPGKPIRFLESILLIRKNEEGIVSEAKTKKKKAEQQELIKAKTKTKLRITRREVIRYFSEETGMPRFMIDPDISMDSAAIRAKFNQQIFGQESAVNSVVNMLATVKTALSTSGKPIASFLFVGPTGVGKTELAKVLAEFMFGNRHRMTRFDMSEYSNPYNVARLTGLGYYSDGLLTSAVRREPFGVLLFDEIEKAHPTFYDLLLQLLSEGRLTDSRGKLVNFCSTIIIMTSNIGASNLQAGRVGFNKEFDAKEIADHFRRAAEKHFRPELFNRIDQIIPFEPLSADTMRFVVNREIKLFKHREGIRFRNMSFHITPKALDCLAKKGYDPRYGARHLQRAIREELVIPLARKLNDFAWDEQVMVEVDVVDKSLVINTEADELALELLLEDLEKDGLAERSSELRRGVDMLQEGHAFIQMQSRLFELEQYKKEHEQKFWQSKSKVQQYDAFLRTRTDFETLRQEIELLEQKLALICLDLAIYNPAIQEELKEWEGRLFTAKESLYECLNPAVNTVFMGIYGQKKEIEKTLAFYQTFFQHRGYEIKEKKSIWYRKSYYEAMELKEIQILGEDGKMRTSTERTMRREYLKMDIKKLENRKWMSQAEEEKDQLWGIELKVKGRGAGLYFSGEMGTHAWMDADTNLPIPSFLLLTTEDLVTPIELHRREFYRHQTPRRIRGAKTLEDIIFDIKIELAADQHATRLLEAFDLRYINILNSYLV